MSDESGWDTADDPGRNTLRGRAGGSQLRLWLLLEADRFGLAAGLALLVFVGFLGVGILHPGTLTEAIGSGNPIDLLFSALIGGIITGTTLVVTISQLVISQENGPIGDQRRRMSNALDFQGYARRLLGTEPPAEPSTLLRTIVEAARENADALREAVGAPTGAGAGDAEGDRGRETLNREVDELVVDVEENAETVVADLDDADFGTYEALSAAVDFNYSWKLSESRRLAAEYADRLTDDERRAFDELETALATFGAAREHVKTLYFQWALIDLSRQILYLALFALVVAGYMLAFVNSSTFTGQVFGVDRLLVVTGAGFTLCLLPFLLFMSYVFRVVTVAKRTLAIGPLILRDSER